MSEVDLLSPQGTKTGTVELPPEVFDVQVNIPLIHQVVVAQLAAARQGTHDTKTRAEVSGGGAKPYRQKGTGRARQGSTRAPHYSGGGVVHGPTPRNYAQRTPKKMKAAALRGALSDRARDGRVHVVTGVVEGDVPSTRTAVTLLAAITERRNVLVVIDRADQLTARSIRNVKGVHLIQADQLNTYDVLVSDDVVFTQPALEAFLAGPIGTNARAVADADAAFASRYLDQPLDGSPVTAATAPVVAVPVVAVPVAEVLAAEPAVEAPVAVEHTGAEVPAPSGATAVDSLPDPAPTDPDEVDQ